MTIAEGKIELIELLKNLVYGLRIEWVSLSQIRILPGQCISADGQELIVSLSNIALDITASGAGGLDTGVEAPSSWYYVWLIKNIATNDVSAVLSASSTSPTLPAGYTKRRRIGAVRNDASSNFLNFLQFGIGVDREYQYREQVNTTLRVLSGGTAATWTDIDCSAFVPSTSVWPYLSAQNDKTAAGTAGELRTKGSTVIQRRVTTSDGRIFYLETDAAQTIQYQRISAATINISVLGFREEL